MSVLDRLSKIKENDDLFKWYHESCNDVLLSDIQEVVALAKQNQKSSIDAMRFEAAKTAMQSVIVKNGDILSRHGVAAKSTLYADALISELQKTKP
jgi:hypothetical protein